MKFHVMAPPVSIIIPTYNTGAVVCNAIDCSLNQTYQNLEIIVVDDGSTDGTEQLLKERYDGRINYIYQENKGPGGARNTGIRNASGKYVQFLDADDLLHPDKINIQLRELCSISGKAVGYCDYECCDMGDTTTYRGRTSPLFKTEKPFDEIMLRWETELSIPMHCFIFDAALFKEYGIAFDETLPSNEDWECWMNVFALDPQVVFIDRVLACYRVRRDSRCRDRSKMRLGWLMAIEKQIQKNSTKKEVVEKLNMRRKQIKYLYRDVGPLGKLLEKRHPLVKKMYADIIPWRIQRALD